MKPADNPAVENLHQRTAQMLTAIDDTPIPQMDATFYQHYHEELRLLAQEWLTATTGHSPTLPDQTWVITKGGLPVGLCTTTTTAAALTAAIPDLTFTPVALCASAIEDLRAHWVAEPCPPGSSTEP